MLSPSGPAVLRAIGIFSALLLGLPVMAEPPVISLENGHLHVGLNQSDGQLAQFTDREAHWNHIADHANSLGLWKLEVIREGKTIELVPSQAKRFQLEPGKEPHSLQLSWSDFGSEFAPQLKVVVKAQLKTGQAMSRWHIAVDNLRGLILERVRFPRFPAIRPQADEYLAVPV